MVVARIGRNDLILNIGAIKILNGISVLLWILMDQNFGVRKKF